MVTCQVRINRYVSLAVILAWVTCCHQLNVCVCMCVCVCVHAYV